METDQVGSFYINKHQNINAAMEPIDRFSVLEFVLYGFQTIHT